MLRRRFIDQQSTSLRRRSGFKVSPYRPLLRWAQLVESHGQAEDDVAHPDCPDILDAVVHVGCPDEDADQKAAPVDCGTTAVSDLRARRPSRVEAMSLVVYAAASSVISERQRVRKSRRCSVGATWAPPRRRTRKYCRTSSNALQKRDADSKLPKPCIG